MAAARRQLARGLLSLSRSLHSSSSSSSSAGRGLLCSSPHAAVCAATASGASGPVLSLRQAWGCRAWHTQWRHNSTISSTQQLLDSVAAARLHDELQDESEARAFMPYEDLLRFIMDHHGAKTQAEAEERAAALIKAGVVLQFNGTVYLRPQEVTELVYKLLPADASTAKHTLAGIEQELAKMDKQHRQIFARAQRWPRRWLYAGCAVLATQLVGMAWLTWWELSWDVMEPVAYILSLSYSLLAYIYFLATRGSYFEQKEFKEYWEQQQLEKTMAAAGFDLDRYHQLRRTRDRYRKYLASAGSLQAAAAAAMGAAAELRQQQREQLEQAQLGAAAGGKLKAM